MSFRSTPLFAGDLYDTALRLAQEDVLKPSAAQEGAPSNNWQQMLALGWQGVLVAEDDGGVGAALDLADERANAVEAARLLRVEDRVGEHRAQPGLAGDRGHAGGVGGGAGAPAVAAAHGKALGQFALVGRQHIDRIVRPCAKGGKRCRCLGQAPQDQRRCQ